MARIRKVSQESKDTSPLTLEQLSDEELATILYIERRLDEARDTDSPPSVLPNGPSGYLAMVEERHPRVLLLDGGRGTGKTSLLLTLVDRWHRWSHEGLQEKAAYKKRIAALHKNPQFSLDRRRDYVIPNYVSVVDILDFDPLPPDMPLIAGIMRAWQSLAEQYDTLSYGPDDCEDGGETRLEDLWHRLFQVASVGWTAIPQNRGLIEQVLDRQQQVADWQNLDKRWREFMYEVIKRGRCLPEPYRLPLKPIFVVMIDDVDLQVERIRALLPALRMLYHPRVFFVVAADRDHMLDMLKFDFWGQQVELSRHRNANPAPAQELGNAARWANELAHSSVNKVFPLRNRWKLRQLTLYELLKFPRKESNLEAILNGWPQQNKEERDFGSLGSYLELMAGPPADPLELPPIIPYRVAHQIFEQASAHTDAKIAALEAIRHIIGRSDSDDVVRMTRRRKQGATAEMSEPDPRIEYLVSGELTALFHKAFREPIENEGVVSLSASPSFEYRYGSSHTLLSTTGSAENDSKITSAMIAASMRDDGYGVVAPGLIWNIRLALAWTQVRVFEDGLTLRLAFQWPVNVHPSPLVLLTWSKDWRDFIHDLSGNTDFRLERIAYAWIYFQLKWLRKDLNSDLPVGLREVPEPFDSDFNTEESWTRLLSLEPETGKDDERAFWRTRRIPLLARPELGLKVSVQEHLLTRVGVDLDVDWLWDQRRRRITDAIVAASNQVGIQATGAEDQSQEERVAAIFESRFKKTYTADSSPWEQYVERPYEESQRRTPKQ